MTTVSLEALIQGIQLNDPRLYQILMGLNGGIIAIAEELHPLTLAARIPPSEVPLTVVPSSFTFIFTPITVRFSWTGVENGFAYEIRKGTTWDTAAFQLRTTSLQADIDALLTGTHNYLLKSINQNGAYSTDSIGLVVTVPQVGAVTIESRVIDNNVLLTWTEPASVFRILHYEISVDGVVVGTVDSTFFTRFANIAGTYTYGIVSIDVAGNRGINSEVDVLVFSPPDYALQDIYTSTLNGTRVNVGLDTTVPPKLIANVITESWEDHFINNGWTNIQDQIDDGFPIYIQPTNLTGSYEEVIDYGVVLSNSIATISFNFNMISPDVSTIVKMATSLDGVGYSAFVAGSSQFVPTMRYLKFRLEFTGTDTSALMEVYNIVIQLNVKRENDGGEITADASDVGGTEVIFNKAFKDIESITCTTKSITEPYYVIFDFTDIPNPVHFFVYVFDSTGNRVTKIVDWKARGII